MANGEKIVGAILNFIVWGLGFLYLKQTKRGLLWLTAFIVTHVGSFLMGWGFLLITTPGKIMALGCTLISLNLAREAYIA